jgi:GAF domain-containing protein
VSDDRLRAAVASGVLDASALHQALLQSIADVALVIFNAKATTIFLLDEATNELVFEAVAGEGSRSLIGRRFPSDVGIAGWVLANGQPLVLDNVADDPRFSREAAESTGYVPTGIMSAPLIHEDRGLGVLQVLDRPAARALKLAEIEVLGMFASQAATALELVVRARRAKAALAESDEDLRLVAALAAAVDNLSGERREAGLRLLRELETVLS